jgi:hypothetical protein
MEAMSQYLSAPMAEMEALEARTTQYRTAEEEDQKTPRRNGWPVPPITTSQVEVEIGEWKKTPDARMLLKLIALMRELEYWMNATVFCS